MKLLVATHNQGKLREMREIFSSLEVIGVSSEVEETEKTFLGNARLKAQAVYAENKGCYVLADDSGLEVEALGGAPGIYSARYAGEDSNSKANNALLLKNLTGISNRRANFTCAIVLITPDGDEITAQGKVFGQIAQEVTGDGGFGYDPLFIPDGYLEPFSILGFEIKNTISHRAKALAELRRKCDLLNAK